LTQIRFVDSHKTERTDPNNIKLIEAKMNWCNVLNSLKMYVSLRILPPEIILFQITQYLIIMLILIKLISIYLGDPVSIQLKYQKWIGIFRTT